MKLILNGEVVTIQDVTRGTDNRPLLLVRTPNGRTRVTRPRQLRIANAYVFDLYELCTVKTKYSFDIYGKIVSKRTPDDTYMVQMVPDDPHTMREVHISLIRKATNKPKFVRYARLYGEGPFPIDMLRYDYCWPVTFNILSDNSVIGDEMIVGSAVHLKRHVFTVARWASFGWECEPLKTLRIQNGRC